MLYIENNGKVEKINKEKVDKWKTEKNGKILGVLLKGEKRYRDVLDKYGEPALNLREIKGHIYQLFFGEVFKVW